MLSALDRRLEELFDTVPDNTVKSIHADHGESIAWRGSTVQSICKRLRDKARYDLGWNTRKIEHAFNRLFDHLSPSYCDHFLENGHGETVFDFMTNVPFIIQGSNIESATVTKQCRQVDVLPTLLDVMDVPVPDHLDGRSGYPPCEINDRTAYLRACGTSLRGKANWQKCIRTPSYKYIIYPQRDWARELYDLSNDEKELRNVAKAQEDTALRLDSLLPEDDLMNVSHAGIDKHLKDLGYL